MHEHYKNQLITAMENDDDSLLNELQNQARYSPAKSTILFEKYNELICLTNEHKSFKCLKFLVSRMNLKLDNTIPLIVEKSVINENIEWLEVFLRTIHIHQKSEINSIHIKNFKTIFSTIKPKQVINSSEPIFNLLIETSSNHNSFYLPTEKIIIDLLNEYTAKEPQKTLLKLIKIIKTYDNNNVNPFIESFSHNTIIELCICKNIKSFFKYYLTSIPELSTNTSYLWKTFNTIGMIGNYDMLEYLCKIKKHKISNNENQINAYIFDGAIRTNNFKFIEYLFKNGARLYPTNDKVLKTVIDSRVSIWYDISSSINSESNSEIIFNLHKLMTTYCPSDIPLLSSEINKSPAPYLANILKIKELHDTLDKKLNIQLNEDNNKKIKI